MGDAGGMLQFQSGSGSSGEGDYVQREFQDVTLPANNNAGFTSTFSNNPLGNFYGNDDCPRYRTKTLWIKDLVLEPDRALWVGGKPTYRIVWHQDYTAVKGYVVGTVEIIRSVSGGPVTVRGEADCFGIGGVMRTVYWLFSPQNATSAQNYTEQIDAGAGGLDSYQAQMFLSTGASLGFAYQGINWYQSRDNGGGVQTRDIHDYRITIGAQTPLNTFSVCGVVAYFESDGQGIDMPGGDTYVNKQLVSSPGSSLVPINVTNPAGGVASIYKTVTAAYGMTGAFVSGISTIAVGTSGTNSLTVSPGTGASFPRGTGVYGYDGFTSYLGVVTSVSTDTLSVLPTLSIGFSGVMNSLWQAGVTYSISATLYSQAFQYTPGFHSATFFGGGFTTGLHIYQDPYLKYRVVGGTCRLVNGLSFGLGGITAINGATTALELFGTGQFLNVTGKYNALEIEFLAGVSAVINATFVINGLPVFSMNEPMPVGLNRKVVLTSASTSQHTVEVQAAAGHTNVAVAQVVGYDLKSFNGPSFGTLAELPLAATFILRNDAAATFINTAQGYIQRIYADQLPFYGSSANTWVFGQTSTAAGGVFVQNAGISGALTIDYFGGGIAIWGQQGSSCIFSIPNSGAAGSSFNNWFGQALSATFRSILIQHRAGTTRVEAIDILLPPEVKSVQKYVPRPTENLTPRYFIQPEEPADFRPGDFWEQSQSPPIVYQRMTNRWVLRGPIPMVKYGATIPQGIQGDSTFIVINFDTSIYDPYKQVQTGPAWTFRPKVAGVYSVQGIVTYLSTAWGTNVTNQTLIFKNGAVVHNYVFAFPNGETDSTGFPFVTEVDLTPADTLNIGLAHSNGSTAQINAAVTVSNVAISLVGGL